MSVEHTYCARVLRTVLYHESSARLFPIAPHPSCKLRTLCRLRTCAKWTLQAAVVFLKNLRFCVGSLPIHQQLRKEAGRVVWRALEERRSNFFHLPASPSTVGKSLFAHYHVVYATPKEVWLLHKHATSSDISCSSDEGPFVVTTTTLDIGCRECANPLRGLLYYNTHRALVRIFCIAARVAIRRPYPRIMRCHHCGRRFRFLWMEEYKMCSGFKQRIHRYL